jgi:hypothetical protein
MQAVSIRKNMWLGCGSQIIYPGQSCGSSWHAGLAHVAGGALLAGIVAANPDAMLKITEQVTSTEMADEIQLHIAKQGI